MSEGEVWIWIVGLIGGAILIGFAIAYTADVLKTRAAERTKRELFAYVAEGTITAQDAMRIIQIMEDSDLRKQLAGDAFWGQGEAGHKETMEKLLTVRAAAIDARPAPAPEKAARPA